MDKMEYLENKRIEVLNAIKPICEVFNITNYDYIVKEKGQTETLKIGEARIGCCSNSVSAVIDELIGYIFIVKWCKNRSLGTFSTQTKNVVKRNWL